MASQQLHTTGHFTACDLDTYNNEVLGRRNTVYGSKRRFMSPAVNMHYGQTFVIVGEATGDKDFDDLRFRTTSRETFNFA